MATTSTPMIWVRDADGTFTETQVIVTDYGAVEVWKTAGEPRMIFSVYMGDAVRLMDELHTAVVRWDAMRLERGEVVVEVDPDSGMLGASLGW